MAPFNRQQVSFYQLVMQEVDTNSTDLAIEKLSPWFFQIASNSVELWNLTPNVEYLLRVHAVNIPGAWEWCKPFKVSKETGLFSWRMKPVLALFYWCLEGC
ncbi:unnamed protein product [Eretmochelys imbricata]